MYLCDENFIFLLILTKLLSQNYIYYILLIFISFFLIITVDFKLQRLNTKQALILQNETSTNFSVVCQNSKTVCMKMLVFTKWLELVLDAMHGKRQ